MKPKRWTEAKEAQVGQFLQVPMPTRLSIDLLLSLLQHRTDTHAVTETPLLLDPSDSLKPDCCRVFNKLL